MSDESELETRMRAVEPGWRFVKERSLAQARRDRSDRGIRTSESVPLALSKADAEAMGCFPNAIFADAPEYLVLAPMPVRSSPFAQRLLNGWRALYSLRAPTTNAVAVWATLPWFAQREIEAVLDASDALPPEATADELAVAWAVDLLTAARFAVEAIPYRYPGLANWPEWRAKLCVDVDEQRIFRETRPAGSTEPPPLAETEPSVLWAASSGRDAPGASRFAQRAAVARRRGNFARAAILYAAAAKACGTGSTRYRGEAKSALREGIVDRLGAVCRWNETTVAAWKAALPPLLESATHGHWSPAAKALYDLQKIAVDGGGDLFAVDPAGWIGSFGRRPLLRKLSLSRVALLHRGWKTVKNHLAPARLRVSDSQRLFALIDPEIDRAERALRAAMEPVLLRVFGEVGLAPANFVERIALPKIVDELLDTTVDKGFIRFGDLRDILSRNRLKMPDLAGPGPFLFGDALLRADAKLGDALDGVYYPGEIYLRWFQRGSAVAFGTKLGRWVTLFAALPFGAAFMTVEFAKYIAHEVAAVARFAEGLFVAEPDAPPHTDKHGGISMSPESLAVVLVLGVFYLGLIHSTALRSFALGGLGRLGAMVHWTFAELPAQIWNSVPLKAVRRNRFARWFRRRWAVPMVGGAAAAIFDSAVDWSDDIERSILVGTFGVLALASNTSRGQSILERTEDAVAWLWRQVRTNFFPGLIGWIVWIFRELLAGLDRLIYSIDEWFRFREGQTKPSLAIKVALALIWFPVRYVLRFAIYLLIEPQINPVKHFPVVTVSHKLLLPMIPAISTAIGVGREWVAGALAGVPGIFGFLAWELKENWRLYAANRPDRVAPLALGHHGESVRGLLRPGFHSGTVPKAYAAIRRAIAKAEATGDEPRFHKHSEKLHGVEHAIRHFAERELIAYLNATEAWAAGPLRFAGVRLGLEHIRVEVAGPVAPAVLRLELIGSSIIGVRDDAAFLSTTTADQRETWERAVLGFFAMGAVESDDPRLDWAEWVKFWEARSAAQP